MHLRPYVSIRKFRHFYMGFCIRFQLVSFSASTGQQEACWKWLGEWKEKGKKKVIVLTVSNDFFLPITLGEWGKISKMTISWWFLAQYLLFIVSSVRLYSGHSVVAYEPFRLLYQLGIIVFVFYSTCWKEAEWVADNVIRRGVKFPYYPKADYSNKIWNYENFIIERFIMSIEWVMVSKTSSLRHRFENVIFSSQEI